jgi:predicted methyltransferase
LAAIDKGERNVSISVDLNKSVRSFMISEAQVTFDAHNRLTKKELLWIFKKPKRVFVLENNELRAVEYRANAYYKLVPTQHAPTVEINGIKMHRSKDIDPFQDAKLKVKQVVREGKRVLDTCGGLGYTAIWAIRQGASEVVSVECNEFIRKLRMENPWSEELTNPKIKLISGDIGEYISFLETESFDSIVHDPPRFSLAGELYGEVFYRELHRVLMRRGRLFHYTGTPYSIRRGDSFIQNTAQRLQSAGFKKVSIKKHLLGIKTLK